MVQEGYSLIRGEGIWARLQEGPDGEDLADAVESKAVMLVEERLRMWFTSVDRGEGIDFFLVSVAESILSIERIRMRFLLESPVPPDPY